MLTLAMSMSARGCKCEEAEVMAGLEQRLSLVHWAVFIIHIHLIGQTPSISGNVKVEMLFAAAPSVCVCFL